MTPAEQLRATMNLLEAVATEKPKLDPALVQRLIQDTQAFGQVLGSDELEEVDLKSIGQGVKRGLATAGIAGAMALGSGSALAGDTMKMINCAAVGQSLSLYFAGQGDADKAMRGARMAKDWLAAANQSSPGMSDHIRDLFKQDVEFKNFTMRGSQGVDEVKAQWNTCWNFARQLGYVK